MFAEKRFRAIGLFCVMGETAMFKLFRIVLGLVTLGLTNAPYAVGTPERNPALPDLPTSIEAGLPDFQASAWNALFAPKGTPKPILDKVSAALDRALDDGATRKRLFDLGSDIPDKTRRGQQALAALVKSEIGKWGPVIKAAGSIN